jgi:hypothetical protein
MKSNVSILFAVLFLIGIVENRPQENPCAGEYLKLLRHFRNVR